MAQKNPQAYLRDMLDNAFFVQSFCQDKSREDVADDQPTRFVIERGLQNIGEAAFQLRRTGAECINVVPDSDRVIATRHILVHGYDEVKPRVLWDIITIHLPGLISALSQYFDELDEESK
ncbi:MAG: HepT-like ribonuclease domain-containing protein [Planctomycetota bacterium]